MLNIIKQVILFRPTSRVILNINRNFLKNSGIIIVIKKEINIIEIVIIVEAAVITVKGKIIKKIKIKIGLKIKVIIK